MADYGAVVYNAAGTVQADSRWPNWVLRGKGSVAMTTDAGWTVGGILSATVTITADTPLLAFSCSANVCLLRATNSGTSYTYYFVNYGSPTGLTLYWWLFDKASSVPLTEDYGACFWDASGVMTWSSEQKPLRMVGVLTDLTSPGTYASERTYAVVQSNLFFHEQTKDEGLSYGPIAPGHKWATYRKVTGSARISSNVVTVEKQELESYGVDVLNSFVDVETTDGEVLYIAVDVTHY